MVVALPDDRVWPRETRSFPFKKLDCLRHATIMFVFIVIYNFLFCLLKVLQVKPLSLSLPLTFTHCLEFTIDPPVGPSMPLIIPEGGDQVLTCRHSVIPVDATEWYREMSAIRDNVPEGREGCSCEINRPNTMDYVELTFTDFGPGSGGEYSCRVPDPFAPSGFF